MRYLVILATLQRTRYLVLTVHLDALITNWTRYLVLTVHLDALITN